MSDFRDPAEARTDGEEDVHFSEGNWQYREIRLSEIRDPISKYGLFEGASSMVEPPKPPIEKDGTDPASSGKNLRRLLRDLEESREISQQSVKKELEAAPVYLNQFLERARTHYMNRDFKACLEILHEGLKLAPGNPEVLSLMEKARQESQFSEADSDLANRMALSKAEAIKLFEQGRYSDCIERFKLLCELDPENRDLRDFLEISQEEAEKQKPPQPSPPIAAPREDQEGTVHAAPTPELPEPALASPIDPFLPADLTEPQKPDTDEISTEPAVSPVQAMQGGFSNVSIPELVTYPFPEVAEQTVPTQDDHERPQEFTESAKETEGGTTAEDETSTPEDLVQQETKILKIVYFVAAGIVIGAVLGVWLALRPPKYTSSPEAQLPPIITQGLENPVQPPSELSTSAEDPQTQAEKAFKQGRLLEANRFCETILKRDPANTFAANLKQGIRDRFFSLGSQAMANQQWEKALAAWNNVLRVVPNDPDALRQLKATRTNLKKQMEINLASKQEYEKRIQELQQNILLAVGTRRYLPPTSGNALELIQQLEDLSPGNAFSKEKLDEIHRGLIATANRSLQAKDYAQANSLVKQIQMYFSETPELKALRESVKAEETRLAETRDSWVQKAETAMAAGHYVTPINDNVVAYCNQLLALDTQNPKALGLRKESYVRATSQAKSLVQEAKYDDARAVYSSLLYILQNDSQVPLNSSELKSEVDKLTANAYAVVHDHAIGSCTGRLRFNGYQIAYLPSTDSKDGFVLKIPEITQVELSDKLKIQFRGKVYRFQANAAKSSQEGRARISEIHERLSAIVASGK